MSNKYCSDYRCIVVVVHLCMDDNFSSKMCNFIVWLIGGG